MKKIFLLAFACLTMMASMNAQDKPHPGHGDRVEMMKSELGLTDEQATQLREKFDAVRQEMEALRKSDLSPQEMREKRRALGAKHKSIVQEVLTPEQMKKLETMRGDRPQHGKHGKPHHHGERGGHMEKMKSELGLTDEQIQQIKEKEKALKKEMGELKGSDLSPEEMHAKHKELRAKRKEAMESVLTPEQKEKLQKLHGERAAKQQEHMEKRKAMKEKMRPMHDEIRAYRKDNVAPVMAAKRAELDKSLKRKERNKVDDFRTLVEESRKEMKQKHAEMRKMREEMHKKGMDKKTGMGKEAFPHHRKGGHHDKHMKGLIMLKTKHPEEFKAMWELSEKYADEIDRLMESLKPQSEQWHKDMKAIKDKHMTEEMKQGFKDMKGGHHGKPHHRGKSCDKTGKSCDKAAKSCDKADAKKAGKADMYRQMKRFHFLVMPANGMMDEDMEDDSPAANIPADRKAAPAAFGAKVFPNPSGTSNTVEFQVPTAGKYKVELYSKEGQLIKTVAEENLSPGTQRYDVDLNSLPAGTYYYIISDGKSRTTQQFVKK